MPKSKQEEMDELDIHNDVYDSLKYGYLKDGPKHEESVKKYLDAWYGNTKDENLKEKIKGLKKGGWFGNADYQVTQPGFRILCEKKTPYRDMKDICKMDNIMDKDPHIEPMKWQGRVIFNLLMFLGAVFIASSIYGDYKQMTAKQKKRR